MVGTETAASTEKACWPFSIKPMMPIVLVESLYKVRVITKSSVTGEGDDWALKPVSWVCHAGLTENGLLCKNQPSTSIILVLILISALQKISMFSCHITTWKTVWTCFLVSNYINIKILPDRKIRIRGHMTPFLLCTYNERNEVQQGHPKYTMLTNNIHTKTFYSWVR